jgi:hypothetical protein
MSFTICPVITNELGFFKRVIRALKSKIMRRTRVAFKNLVATEWGFNVYRSVDALNMCVHKMLWEEMREEILYKRKDYEYWGIFGTKASDQIDRRERAGRPKQLSKTFLKQINEQIKRAEIVESARLNNDDPPRNPK